MKRIKTDDQRKLERAIGLKAIATTAQHMQDTGSDPIEIRTFIGGARKKLAEVAPDPEMYSKALEAAVKYKELGKSKN